MSSVEAEHPIHHRRSAVAELGDAMRDATVAASASEVSPDDLAEAAALARRMTAILSRHGRALSELPSVDDLSLGLRYFSPVTGRGNPMSPPLVLDDHEDGGVLARAVFDRRFEGPPGYVHGGITALMLDEVLGQAATRARRWGMTAFLNTTYRRALPIDVELEFRSWITGEEGRKTTVAGSIALASDPTTIFVEASALFIEPRAEMQADYFADLRDLDGNPKSARHGMPPAP
jgi:acyl-coenzyme A thioesterase PaaI-like protein